MKQILALIILVSFSGYSQSKCELVSSKSHVKWKGFYVVGGGHEGIIKLESGYIVIAKDGRITKGDFVIDMTSIRNEDEKNENDSRKLDNHLKSEDFFAATEFPKAYFSIIQIDDATLVSENYQNTVKGFLTIKGIAEQITFPASINVDNNIIKVEAELIIDRTKWGVVYQSASFFSDLKDGVISDDIELRIDLTFLKRNIK